MIGVESVAGDAPASAAAADRVLEAMKDAGYLLGKTGPGRNVLTFMPPLIVGEPDLPGAVDAFEKILGELWMPALAFAVGAACAAVVGGCTSFKYLTRAGEDGVTCVSCHLEEGTQATGGLSELFVSFETQRRRNATRSIRSPGTGQACTSACISS